MSLFDKFKTSQKKEVYSIDRPVIVDGVDVLKKLDERLTFITENMNQIKNVIDTEYTNCIEGSPKSNKRRELQKTLQDHRLKEIWFLQLKKVIKEENAYSLSIIEAINLGFIDDVTI